MKTCSKCGEVRGLDEYHKLKASKDGRQSRCKECASRGAAEWYAANRDRALEQMARYRARPEIKAHRAEYHAEHWAEYYEQNRDRRIAQSTEYHEANPHVRWIADYRARAKRYGFGPVVEAFTRDDLIAQWGDACFHCGGEWSELDHFPVPVSRGGSHTLENARPSCLPCNRRAWAEYRRAETV